MAKKLDFKDFLTVDYAPGMPDLIKKKAKKRKMDSGAGTNAEYSSTHSPEEDIDTIDEKAYDPSAGQHAKNVGMGYTGKHKIVKVPGDKKGKHTHIFQFAGEESFKPHWMYDPKTGDKKWAEKPEDHEMLGKKGWVHEKPDLDELSMSVKDFKKTGLNKTVTKNKDKLKKDLEAMKARLNKEEVEEVDEALSLQQRRALSRRMKLKRRKIEVGRKRALARAADPARLKKRATKAARNALFKKLAKGKSRSELPPQRRAEIEKRMAKMGNRITRLATKLLPQVRKIDKERRASKQEEK